MILAIETLPKIAMTKMDSSVSVGELDKRGNKLYLAHPFGRREGKSEEEQFANVQHSIELTRELMLRGWNVFNPLLYWYVHDGWKDTPREEEWLELFLSWVDVCDALFNADPHRDSNQRSRGSYREEIRTREQGKIVYIRLEDVPFI